MVTARLMQCIFLIVTYQCADLFNRVAWQVATRTRVKTGLCVDAIACVFDLPANEPAAQDIC